MVSFSRIITPFYGLLKFFLMIPSLINFKKTTFLCDDPTNKLWTFLALGCIMHSAGLMDLSNHVQSYFSEILSVC